MPTGVILAYSVPSGAQVLIDRRAQYTIFGIARTPAMIHGVAAGVHHVTFTLVGYEDVIMTIDVPQGGFSTTTAILHSKT